MYEVLADLCWVPSLHITLKLPVFHVFLLGDALCSLVDGLIGAAPCMEHLG